MMVFARKGKPPPIATISAYPYFNRAFLDLFAKIAIGTGEDHLT
jgi:hypothetical protein